MAFGLAALALIVQLYARTVAQTPDACMAPTTTADTGGEVDVSPAQVFAVVLASNPSTGYSWSISVQPDPAVAVAVDSLALPPATSLIGAPGRECFRFMATGAGQTRAEFSYTRPFEPDAPPAQTVDVAMSVSAPALPVQIPSQ
ncbi:MAG: protease inhibitor I42 family protein [Chloroflexi bacterium]|nr:protease inhibitor I42 family protein [Chloroflexota bacterium]